MKQTTFASLAWANKKKVTRRERFLAEMDAVVPWARIEALIAPHYPKGTGGRPALPLATMLRIYFMQQWFNLSDPQAEDMLYDSESMRRFAQLELNEEALPDETTILRFRRLLEKHRLTEAIFAEVRQLLEERQLLLKSGTIVDATIISAPASTKNAKGTRDPEMTPTQKGNTWHFGMKVHVGADAQGRGLVHTVLTSTARAADIVQLPHLLHGRERTLYGDRAYWSQAQREAAQVRGLAYRINRKARTLTPGQRRRNCRLSRIRAKVEHGFHVVKRLWGFAKVRYRGLEKNTVRVFAIFALANLYRARRELLAS